jgi:hypothetical protein
LLARCSESIITAAFSPSACLAFFPDALPCTGETPAAVVPFGVGAGGFPPPALFLLRTSDIFLTRGVLTSNATNGKFLFFSFVVGMKGVEKKEKSIGDIVSFYFLERKFF